MRGVRYVGIVSVLCLVYLIGLKYYGVNCKSYNETVTVIVAIAAAVAVWFELRSNEHISEANVIVELNNQFIANPELTKVECDLEKYFDAYKNGESKEIDKLNVQFRKKYRFGAIEHQYLVNYLVHLEGIATLVNDRVLRLNAINDLMAYRYFIAVNNPIVQELELLDYKPYYKGIFKVYKRWSWQFGKKNIPMCENSLIKRYKEIKKQNKQAKQSKDRPAT